MSGIEIAVTGIGLVSPLGHDAQSVFRRLVAGQSAIGLIRNFDTHELPSHWGAEIHELPPVGSLGPGVQFLDRYLLLALGSVVRAAGDAKLAMDSTGASRVGVVFGGWLPGLNSVQDFISTYDENGVGAVSPMSFPNCAFNAAASQAGIRFKFRAANATVSSGAATGLSALEYACQQIREGEADQMVVSAVQELGPILVAGYAQNGLLIPRDCNGRENCSPFDRGRQGTVLGEVGCSLVIESLAHAVRRGAHVLARISIPYTGFVPGACRPLSGPRKEESDALAAILRSSLDLAAVGSDELDYVSAAANGCPFGDAFEALALRSVVGECTSVGSIKGSLGELVGAAPLVQIAMCIQALHEGIVPPTLNFRRSDPGCALPGLSSEPRQRTIRAALVSSLCWSGTAGGVVIRRGGEA